MATGTIKKIVKSQDITVTTSSTGAVNLPEMYQDKLVGWASVGAIYNIFRRDVGWLAVRDFYNPATAIANTTITIRLYYI